MKKILLLLAGFAFSLSSVSAQCVPDTTITDIIQPPAGSTFDTVGGEPIVILPYAQVNQSYSETMHFKIPEDTTYIVTGTVDSVKLLNVINLPGTFSMNCTPSNCVFPGGSYGCGEMSGTPTTPDSVELRVAIEYTVTVMGSPTTPIKDTLGGFYLVIKGDPMSAAENALVQNAPKLYPNPASDRLFIEPHSSFKGDVELRISNILGSTVYRKNFTGTTQPLNVNVSGFRPGVYLYSLRSEEKTYSGKFSIAR